MFQVVREKRMETGDAGRRAVMSPSSPCNQEGFLARRIGIE